MERIIAGRFQTKDGADAVAALHAPYIDSADIFIFHNNPPGQHGTLGMRRESVIDASRMSQKYGVIEYDRSFIIGPDRQQLVQAQACECYTEVRQNYERFLPEYRHFDLDPGVMGSFATGVHLVS